MSPIMSGFFFPQDAQLVCTRRLSASHTHHLNPVFNNKIASAQHNTKNKKPPKR